MTTSESKCRFFQKTNRFESIRLTNRIANWNALSPGPYFNHRLFVGSFDRSSTLKSASLILYVEPTSCPSIHVSDAQKEAIETDGRLSQVGSTAPRSRTVRAYFCVLSARGSRVYR